MANSGGSAVAHANRLVGSLPKVGIRPAIDGRRKGIRESLENQTMGMAQTVAKLISEKSATPDGAPVECVMADSCIGGVAEAAQTAEKFARAGVGVSLTVSPCWCYGSETMDMDPLYAESRLGIQRHGAAWGRLSGRRVGRAHAKGAARVRHLRPRRSGRRRAEIPADVLREDSPLRPRRPGRRRNAGKVVPLTRQRLDGHRRFAGQPRFLRALPRHARRDGRHGRTRPPRRAKDVRRRGVCPGLAWTKAHCKEGKDYNRPRASFRPPKRSRHGSGRSKWP